MLIRVLTAAAADQKNVDARSAEPVTFGVPLPKGLVKEPSDWALGPAWSAVQTRVLDRWPDGSARWVLVDAQVNPGTGTGSFDLDLNRRVEPGGRPVLKVTAADGRVTVDTGAARFEMQAGVAFPFHAVESDRNLVAAASSRLVATDSKGGRHEARVARVQVEASGAVRATVRLDGRLELDGRALSLTARLDFYAGHSTVRLSVTVTNTDPARHEGGFWDLGDPGSILFKDLSLTLALKPGKEGAVLTCSPETGRPPETCQAPFEVYQDSSGGAAWNSTNHLNRERRIPVTFAGYRLRSGSVERMGARATPVLTVRRNGREAGVAVPHFWQNFPKAVEVDAASSVLTVRLFPGQFADLHELQGGEQKTHVCWIAAGPDAVSTVPLDWCREPTRLCVSPEWSIESGAVPLLAPLDPRHAALVGAAIEGPDTFESKREVIDQYGWRHFGEVYGDHEAVRQKDPPLVSHYNNQYDVVAGLVLQYLRTGDVRWWTLADELAAHVIDIDIYHTDRDKSAYNGGMFWHTYHYGDADIATHRTYPKNNGGHTHGGGPSADHNYATGLMLHHFLTGDEASREAVIGLGNYVINLDDGRLTIFRFVDRSDTGRAISSAPGYYGPGRGAANSLNALVDGYRLSRDPRLMAKAEQLIKRVVHPDDGIARYDLNNHELRWFYTMFLQALARYVQFKRDDNDRDDMYMYARACLLHYARWMAEHTYPYLEKPEKLQFPTETWAAQDIRKGDVFFAAAHETTDERERERFLERGEFFFRYSVETLAGMPTRVFCRPVAVLLSSGLFRSWLAAMERPEPLIAPVLNVPEIFVPQRTKAERRVRQLAVAGAIVVVGILVWLVI